MQDPDIFSRHLTDEQTRVALTAAASLPWLSRRQQERARSNALFRTLAVLKANENGSASQWWRLLLRPFGAEDNATQKHRDTFARKVSTYIVQINNGAAGPGWELEDSRDKTIDAVTREHPELSTSDIQSLLEKRGIFAVLGEISVRRRRSIQPRYSSNPDEKLRQMVGDLLMWEGENHDPTLENLAYRLGGLLGVELGNDAARLVLARAIGHALIGPPAAETEDASDT